ncbi:MAG: YjiH family protein, partial [Defluviitaleaceae bacterium]|nr:YjiH family protein [Defluviitaleaceae bacterium]
PDWLIGWGGGRLMMDLIAGGSSGSNLITIFIVLGLAIPLLTDFGLMEFLGVLIRKIVRFLFTLPGRSSIDLMGSWFSSSAAGVIITRDQHEKGYYTGREAAAICVNFTFVSLPFTFVIASVVGLTPYFWLFYLIICITVIILAVIMPRIWPLRGLTDEYLPEVGKQIDEETPENVSLFSQAVSQAGIRASKTGAVDVIKSGLSNWLNIFMELIPVILAWGTIALIIESQTPIFEWLSLPFGWLLNLLGVYGAFEYAPAAIVGFIDMYIPALLLSGKEAVYTGTSYLFEGLDYGYEMMFTVPVATRFILGALSIVQIIYLAETGILILKSKIPLNIGHLAIIFIMRTVFALPILVLLTRLLFNA